MEWITIVTRTIFIYFYILIVFRLMGKREVGQLSVFDIVVAIMIAEVAVISIENPKLPFFQPILVIGLLAMIQIGLSYVLLKSEKIRTIVDGKPSVIIYQGKIDEEEMRRQRYNMDDLLTQLRQKDVFNPKDIEYAILETSGELSIIKKKPNASKRSAIKRELQLAHPLIQDGKIQYESLKKIGKNDLWIRQEMRKLGYKDIKKISYCSLNDKNDFYIDLKDEKE